MLRLFRRLRQRFLFEKKFSKYLLYATGEVIILILGIVIALQVNNWNEERKNRATEIELYRAIKRGLEMDLELIESDLKVHHQQVKSSEIILNYLENDLQFQDSLALHFSNTCSYTIFGANRGPYQTLLSVGVSILSNAELRDSIIILYDGYHNYYSSRSEALIDKNTHVENFVFDKRFDQAVNFDNEAWWESQAIIGSMVPLDYESLKQDSEYFYALRTLRNHNINYIYDLKFLNEFVNEVKLNIEKELLRLEE
jgi:hypothetical protein